MNTQTPTQKILSWFDKEGRHTLPWRHHITPYRVWVSEIMLQQTQVSTVIPYFERFIQKFPSLEHLAKAKEDEVLHLWTGLGYYSRARNLYTTAQIISKNHQGQFPADLEQLQNLPGIGLSTAGAIMAIGFNQCAPILDANVKRVLTRYHAIEGWPNSPAISRQLWALASQHTSSLRPADYTQAIMDLGATVCTRQQPKCVLCPLESKCEAHKQERETLFPSRKPRKDLKTRSVYFVLLRNKNGDILLQKRPPTGIWGSLWSFPELSPDIDINNWCAKFYTDKILNINYWPSFRHTFSHFHLHITPVLINIEEPSAKQIRETVDTLWYNPKMPIECGLASPVKKLLEGIL